MTEAGCAAVSFSYAAVRTFVHEPWSTVP